MHILGQKIISISLGLSQKKRKLKSGYLKLPFSVLSRRVPIVAALFSDSWYIGLTDNEVEGEWHWIKSKTHLNGHYAKWAPGEPNDQHVENCAYLAASGPDWYDVSCDGKYHYICEL